MTASDRFVVAGLARARTEWFRSVAAWATSGALAADFVKLVSVAELRMQVTGGRPFSAALLDAGLPSVDRDVVQALRDAGVAPIVVEAGRDARGWRDLGVAAVLPASFTRDQLEDTLRATARPVVTARMPRQDDEHTVDAADPARAPLVAVCGPGGTGASTVAIALAQGLAARRDQPGPVLLADLCRRADQALLHDARDIVPGVQELVEAHRARRLDAAEVRALTFRVTERGYHLLLGLRRPAQWTTLRPRAVEAAVDGIREAFSVVIADTEPDLEGEQDTGSIDVEERHVLSRTAVGAATVVVLVGRPGIGGLYGLVRTIRELRDHGVPAPRLLPVVTPDPRSAARRGEYRRALAELVGAWGDDAPVAAPLWLPRRRLDEALRDGVPLPKPLPELLARAVTPRLGEPAPPHAEALPQPVSPGALGLSP